MAYDANAQKLAVKVIGTVESNLNYGAVNFNDPITVGIAQWYGTRAANVLVRMYNENEASWYGVEESIFNQLATIDSNDPFWNSRYLTQVEGNSLVGVMTRNQAIQNTQLTEDLDVYKAVAISYGFDPETNTAVVIYFFSMHHQSPASALEVVMTLDTECTLEQMHAACLAHSVLGQYGSRYRTTYDLIVEGDVSGVDPTPPEEPEPVQPNANARFIRTMGDSLVVHFVDGEDITYYPNGPGYWVSREAKVAPIPPPPVQPEPPSGAWFHPLPGATITSPYGYREGGFHWGVDLSTTTAPSGGNVIAVTDLVITVAVDAYEGGNSTAGTYVKGHTVDGAYTFSYAHGVDESLAVAAGTTVPAGTVLFVEGQTGYTLGTHCHFECYEGNQFDPWAPPYGNPIDPLPVLRAHGVII